jgi:glycogen debranching enzyme
LLQKTTFGQGNLFEGNLHKIVAVNPKIIGSLLDIPNLVVFDEKYEVRTYLTAAVTADSTTTISVANPADFEVGDTLTFYDVSAGTSEDETISAVSVEAGTVTVSTAPSTSYKSGEDYVYSRKYFVPSNKFVMVSSRVEGQPIAEFKRAPFGLDRHYGLKTDRKEEWDPAGVMIRVQDKGLPVIYQRDGIYTLTVN